MTQTRRTSKDGHLLLWESGYLAAEPTSKQLAEFRETYKGELERLDRVFEVIENGWRRALPGRHNTGERPCDGRPRPYPGRPNPYHPDADNEAHYRWVLMVLYFMSRFDVDWTLQELAAASGWHSDTLKPLLEGHTYGKGLARVDVTFALCRYLLRIKMPLSTLLRLLEQWGDWTPDEIEDPCFWLDDGRARRKAPTHEAQPGNPAELDRASS